MGLNILRGGSPKLAFEVYFIKAVRYGFLADVIFLFTIHQGGGVIELNDLFLTGTIMLMYFVGQIQKKHDRQFFFKVRTSTNIPGYREFINRLKPVFDIRLEFLVVVFALGLLVLFYFYPNFAYNFISNWFLESILNIEDTPVFGFIFKVVGFFFLISVMMKVFGSIVFLLTGRRQTRQVYEDKEDDDYDDYTEVK